MRLTGIYIKETHMLWVRACVPRAGRCGMVVCVVARCVGL